MIDAEVLKYRGGFGSVNGLIRDHLSTALHNMKMNFNSSFDALSQEINPAPDSYSILDFLDAGVNSRVAREDGVSVCTTWQLRAEELTEPSAGSECDLHTPCSSPT